MLSLYWMKAVKELPSEGIYERDLEIPPLLSSLIDGYLERATVEEFQVEPYSLCAAGIFFFYLLVSLYSVFFYSPTRHKSKTK